MKAHSIRLELESLEDRCVPSAVPYDFNGDGLEDKVAITSPTEITVSLANPDGGYTVSQILSLPKNHVSGGLFVGDYNSDGNLDVETWSNSKTGVEYSHVWYGNGDGSFGQRDSQRNPFKNW